MKVVPLRLQPGVDLRQALETWMGEQQEQAGCVISAVGSLSVAQLRFAGAAEATTIHGELEILSLSGTLSADGAHIHIVMADSSGAVIGGHLFCRSGGSVGSWIRVPVTPNYESVLGLWAEGRQPPLHLQQHQPGPAAAGGRAPVRASAALDAVAAII